ncbi:transposase, partial [Lysinibacillus xylanilyticus]|uniref:transposase n=1 Tax=Lysinibacillus xylanilyticus TaxID=582475 RepID=UPI0037FD46E5
MAKYTAEDKLQAVERYLSGKESSHDLAKSIGTDNKAILKWVKQYEYNGVEAFIQPYTNYTLEFKMDVLN